MAVQKLLQANANDNFDIILLQELPGTWFNPLQPEAVQKLLGQAFPPDSFWILVLHHLVTVVRKTLTIAEPSQRRRMLFK